MRPVPMAIGAAVLAVVVAAVVVFQMLGETNRAAAQSANGVYDTDGDGLIEISNLEQLNAVRYDYAAFGPPGLQEKYVLGGANPAFNTHKNSQIKGPEADAHRAAYYAAFPVSEGETVCESEACGGYELTRSLDFEDPGSYASGSVNADWIQGKGWEPIFPWFRGHFDGNGHTISNLYINRPGTDYHESVGLFTRVSLGVVRNISLVDVQVHGGAGAVGGLAGELVAPIFLGTIGGKVILGATEGPNHVAAAILDSHVSGSVSGVGDGRQGVGGLVGTADGVSAIDDWLRSYSVNIADSSFAGTVSAEGEERKVGGIVGYYLVTAEELSLDLIQGSSAEGAVSAEGGWGYAGGLVGESDADITDSHASAAVEARGFASKAGGLAGVSSMRIFGSSASGNVSGEETAGGLVGSNSGIIRLSDAAGDVTGSPAGGLVGSSTGIVVRSHATGDVSAVSAEGSYSTVAGGLVGALVPGNTEPILDISAPGIMYSYATGNVDSTDAGSVPGSDVIGGLVSGASREGTILASFATGDVTSSRGVAGGLSGSNHGAISRSYATGNVAGNEGVGGLTGANLGSIGGSYSAGKVTGVNMVGGLSGSNGGSIRNSYAIGSVSSDGYDTGGLVGVDMGSMTRFTIVDGQERVLGTRESLIEAAYWDTQTTGRAGGVGGARGASGKTTAELQEPTDYTGIYAAWKTDVDNADGDDDPTTGIDDIWDFRDGSRYPALKADFDDDGEATWQEFGNQFNELPRSGVSISQAAGPAAPESAATPRPTAMTPAKGASTSTSEAGEQRKPNAAPATAEPAAAVNGSPIARPESAPVPDPGGGCGIFPGDAAADGGLLLLLAPLAVVGGLRFHSKRRRDGGC